MDRNSLLTACAAAAAGGLCVYALLASRGAAGGGVTAAPATDAGASTTSSAQGTGVYETDKAVAEYLMFHFGAPGDILPYPPSIAPHGALDFAARTGRICARAAAAAGLPLDAALDVGCAVGGTAFDLSRDFSRVVGIDFSHAFVAAANALKAAGAAGYTCAVEGELCAKRTAVLPPGVRAERAAFRQGDACALATAEELGGRFTVIHGANLLCRLPDPMCVGGGGCGCPPPPSPPPSPHLTPPARAPLLPPPTACVQALSPPAAAAARAPRACGAGVPLFVAAAVHGPRKVAGRPRLGRRGVVRGPPQRHAGPQLFPRQHRGHALPHPGARAQVPAGL
jgi:hypothetical protein